MLLSIVVAYVVIWVLEVIDDTHSGLEPLPFVIMVDFFWPALWAWRIWFEIQLERDRRRRNKERKHDTN